MRTWQVDKLLKACIRKKNIIPSQESKLAKCLSTLDLTILGIGSTLGVGIYVLAGSVSKNLAGPAVILSFAIAAVASMFAGLCYAEFAARVPRAGSAYVYSYVTMGELIAFLIGWTLILEYIIGSASVVRALSDYVDDNFLNNSMKNAFQSTVPINVNYLATYPDFFAFTVTIFFSVAIAFGAKTSSLANNVLTFINLSVVLFVIVAGSFKADLSNWNTKPTCTENDCKYGQGGFAPYGISGILKGAATCFYGFIGFDCVATTGEEAQNPQKSIPIAIIASLLIIFLAYFAVSTVLTTVLPYYQQDPVTPFTHLFHRIGWDWASYIVSVGAICALCASLLGAMFPLPRIVYAMASDGLIFKWMGKVNTRFHTPMLGTLSTGLLTAILAAIFDLEQLVNMMSIGTLLAYSIVGASILILRYKENDTYDKENERSKSFNLIVKQFINSNKLTHPTSLTSKIVTFLVFFYSILCIFIAVLISNWSDKLLSGQIFVVILFMLLAIALVCTLWFIHRQPISGKHLTFSVPFVPFLPALSILINVYLMMMLDKKTWVRFTIWMAVGLAIYFFYGAHNSTERNKKIKPKSVENGIGIEE